MPGRRKASPGPVFGNVPEPVLPHLPSPPVAEGVVIRPERDADHPAIAEVVRAAFVGHPDEVASFAERIRASEHFIPELALVAEDSSGVIAHVILELGRR